MIKTEHRECKECGYVHEHLADRPCEHCGGDLCGKCCEEARLPALTRVYLRTKRLVLLEV